MVMCVDMKIDVESTNMKNIKIIKDEPMSRHTSWRAGGVAKQYVQPESLAELASFVATLPEDEDLLWMGLGSNVLIRDGEFDGTAGSLPIAQFTVHKYIYGMFIEKSSTQPSTLRS